MVFLPGNGQDCPEANLQYGGIVLERCINKGATFRFTVNPYDDIETGITEGTEWVILLGDGSSSGDVTLLR